MMNPPFKLLLINPPYFYFRFKSRFVPNYSRPPLGIAYLASYIRKYLGHPIEIKILDCTVEGLLEAHAIQQAVVDFNPDIVGFSIVTPAYDIAAEISRGVRKALPHCRIVKGGPHITAMPDEEDPSIDAKIIGEGEETLLQYIRAEMAGDSESPIDGLIRFRDGKGTSPVLTRALIEPIDSIPFPARDLLRLDRYYHTYPYRPDGRFTTMMISRGCPYSCSFCASNRLWQRRVRFHSPDHVRAELAEVNQTYGINLVSFDDDSFLLNQEFSRTIMRFLTDDFPDIQWICHARASEITEDTARTMAESGCREIQIGVESGSQRILDEMNKGISLQDVRNAFLNLEKNKIKSWATFVLGTTGETKQTFEETTRFAMEINPTYASFIILLPFPGCRLFEEYKKKRWLKTMRWSDYNWYSVPVFETDLLSQQDIVWMQKKAYFRYYIRPKKLFSILNDVWNARSLKEIIRSFIAWLSILLNSSSRRV